MQKHSHPLFVPGKRYRVVRRTVTAVSEFSAGEMVRLSDSAYSRYDCSTAFSFISEDDGEQKTWFTYDGLPDDGPDIFEPL